MVNQSYLDKIIAAQEAKILEWCKVGRQNDAYIILEVVKELWTDNGHAILVKKTQQRIDALNVAER